MPASPLPDHVLRRRLEVGRRIRDARLWRNLTQEALAELAGLERKAVSRIETGAMSPTVDHLLDLAAAMDVSPRELLPEWPRPPDGT